MSNLLKNTSLSLNTADKIISETLHKCDDGELYLEDTKFETVTLDDNKIKSSDYSTDTGYGFRAVTDDVIAYSHSNEISEESLKKLKEKAKVVSSVELSGQQQKSLATKLKQITGAKQIKLALKVDPELIGGFTVEMGSTFIDTSIKNQLSQLANTLGA